MSPRSSVVNARSVVTALAVVVPVFYWSVFGAYISGAEDFNTENEPPEPTFYLFGWLGVAVTIAAATFSGVVWIMTRSDARPDAAPELHEPPWSARAGTLYTHPRGYPGPVQGAAAVPRVAKPKGDAADTVVLPTVPHEGARSVAVAEHEPVASPGPVPFNADELAGFGAGEAAAWEAGIEEGERRERRRRHRAEAGEDDEESGGRFGGQ